MTRIRRWLDIIVPGLLLLAAIVVRVNEGTAVEQVRHLVFDSYQRLAPRPYEEAPVRIADIDEESLKRLGQWPWPRSLLARLVDRLSELGAAAVAIDVLLAEPDRTAPGNLLAQWSDRPDFGVLKAALDKLPDPDAALAQSLARANAVTAFVLTEGPAGREPALKAGFAHAGDDPALFAPNLPAAVTSLPAFEAAAAGNGSANTVPDPDGVVRRVPLLFSLGDRLYPSLTAEALRIAQGASTYTIKSSGASGEESFGQKTGVTHVRIGQAVVPTDRQGSVLLYDTGPVPGRYVPVWRILEPDFDPAPIRGQIVFIGTSVAGLKDVKATPLDPVMPGVELHAQIAEQIILGRYLARPDWAQGAEVLYLLVFGAALILAIRRVGPAWSALIAAAAVVIAFAGSWAAFSRAGWLLDPLFPTIVALVVYTSGSLIRHLRTEREKRFVRNTFSLYLSPVLVEALARQQEPVRLGGELRELTVMFCDIRGFTRIAETLDPQALTHLINGFLTPMTTIIQERCGTIDKYIGDCIMAFWNAPLSDAAHARHAVKAALAMRAELVRLNEVWRAEAAQDGRPPIEVGMGLGLNTGTCCVGNLGSEQRLAYSALGDTVNLASRLEGLSRAYGVDIVLAEDTARQAGAMAFLALDQVRVKGRAAPVQVFTVLGDETFAAEAPFAALAEAHQALLAAYRAQAWAEARAALAACRAQPLVRAGPVDLTGLYDLYERRIAGYEAEPPPADWDGVWVPTTKTG
ncbi:MAG: adenylate/guanylate cyclase domain-containing protein [Rhodospirillaceae bacterium]|nr:adenylate/guanylate cyclase domain-containing protein [Rhodospirillaceae bacterium]